MSQEARYAQLVDKFRAEKGVTNLSEGKGFGSSGQLNVDGRIFAMLVRDELVVKLPRERVDALVDQGEGARIDAGKGRPMREWFVLSPASKKRWTPLAREAFDFVKAFDKEKR